MSDLLVTNGIAHDSASRANLEITYAHAAVHRDIIVGFGVRSSGNTEILFRAPADPVEIRLLWSVVSAGAVDINFIENPTVTDDGTAVDIYRLNRKSVKATQALVFLDPTFSGGDTLLEAQAGAGGFLGGSDGSVALHQDAEFILKPSTDYIIQVLGSSDVTFAGEWYEVGV